MADPYQKYSRQPAVGHRRSTINNVDPLLEQMARASRQADGSSDPLLERMATLSGDQEGSSARTPWTSAITPRSNVAPVPTNKGTAGEDEFLEQLAMLESRQPVVGFHLPGQWQDAPRPRAGESVAGSSFSPPDSLADGGDAASRPRLVRAFGGEDDVGEDVDEAGSGGGKGDGGGGEVPTGVNVTRSGLVLVVSGEALRVFSPHGQLKATLGSGAGVDGGRLMAPWDVFESGSGKIVVTDAGTADLKVFSSRGRYLVSSTLGHHLAAPRGTAYHPRSKRLLIADHDARCVYVHDHTGVVDHVLTTDDPASCPDYVATDAAGRAYVSDAGAHALHVFSAQGELLTTYGSEGSGDGELNSPGGVVVDSSGHVLLADTGNSRVIRLHPPATTDEAAFELRLRDHLLTWEDGVGEPLALALDRDGCLVVTEARTGLVKVFDYSHVGEEGV